MTTYRLCIEGVPDHDFGRGPLAQVCAQAVDLLRDRPGYTAIIRPVDSLSIVGVEVSRVGDGFVVAPTEQSIAKVDRWVDLVPDIITRSGGSLADHNDHPRQALT